MTILLDRDDYEICFVEDIAFYDLATPTYDVINWADRATRGGDGNPLPFMTSPTTSSTFTTSTITNKQKDDDDDVLSLNSILNKLNNIMNTKKPLILYFNATWCKACAKIKSTVDEIVKEVSYKW